MMKKITYANTSQKQDCIVSEKIQFKAEKTVLERMSVISLNRVGN